MTETVFRVLVSGRVQGVGYRDFVRSEAEARGLTGWVRNRRDGAVEAAVRGSRESLDELVAACWRGPPASRVADVQVECLEAADPDLPAVGFAIRPTA